MIGEASGGYMTNGRLENVPQTEQPESSAGQVESGTVVGAQRCASGQ